MWKNKKALLLLLCTLLWIAFIFGQSAQPATVSDKTSDHVLEQVQKVIPNATVTPLRKSAHLFEFFVLGLLLALTCRGLGGKTLLPPLAMGLFAALCDETIQIFSNGRSAEVVDVWIDFGGVLLGTLVMEAARKICLRRKNAEKKS